MLNKSVLCEFFRNELLKNEFTKNGKIVNYVVQKNEDNIINNIIDLGTKTNGKQLMSM